MTHYPNIYAYMRKYSKANAIEGVRAVKDAARRMPSKVSGPSKTGQYFTTLLSLQYPRSPGNLFLDNRVNYHVDINALSSAVWIEYVRFIVLYCSFCRFVPVSNQNYSP